MSPPEEDEVIVSGIAQRADTRLKFNKIRRRGRVAEGSILLRC